MVSKLLDTFGKGIGMGYNISCRFQKTVNRSPLGTRTRELQLKCLVGAFHGHAHNFSRPRAQLNWQKIVEFMTHTDDFETAQECSEFLVNNYQQVLQILATRDALGKMMDDQGIPSADVFLQWLEEERVFLQWLEEERVYLAGLSKEPVEETLGMDYYQKLVSLDNANAKVAQLTSTWHVFDPHAVKSSKQNSDPETQASYALEMVKHCLVAVQTAESELGITRCWTRDSEEWKAAAIMVGW
ncbi:hypothetical protein H0H92_000317 [Tricholoma furcatifolium]|nr:hypothetical protein H0H92_000317 [Tricholoma furcatifolium]